MFARQHNSMKNNQFKLLKEKFSSKYSQHASRAPFSLMVDFKDDFQVTETMTDNYPLLSLRKQILTVQNYISYCCNQIVSTNLFEICCILVILLNSIILAIGDPKSKPSADEVILDYFFLIFYTVEAALKICAAGFYFPKTSYLKDNWNKLDFMIVVTSLISFIFQLENLTYLRVFRVLRPLRSIQRIKSLKKMMEVIFSSFVMLKDTLAIMFFFFMVVSICS